MTIPTEQECTINISHDSEISIALLPFAASSIWGLPVHISDEFGTVYVGRTQMLEHYVASLTDVKPVTFTLRGRWDE